MTEPQTKEVKVLYRRSTALWLTLGVILFLSLCNALNLSFFQAIENKSIDFRFGVRGFRKPQAPVRILAVDEKSLREVGQWPWPRAFQAQLVRKLKAYGVKCVFYDVFFPEPERTQEKLIGQLKSLLDSAMPGDSAQSQKSREKILADLHRLAENQNGDLDFAKAIKEAGNVFLPIEPFINGKEGRSPNPESLHMTGAELFGGFTQDFITAQSLLLSIPGLQNNVRDSGHIRYFPYSDGIYRYFPTAITYKEKLIPHISLQVARYLLDDPSPIKIHSGEYAEVAGRKIPITQDGFALINYCGKQGTIPTYSASDALFGRLDPADLKGTAVMIGVTATGLFDLRPTPFSRAFPGVEINANILENVYSGSFLRLLPDYWTYLLILVLGLLIWYLVPRLTPMQGTAGFIFLLAAYITAACLCFNYMFDVINLIYPLTSLTLTFLTLTTYKFRTEVKYSRYLKQTFQSMVTPKVVEEILRLPAGIELGGEEKDLTVMFADIRGFTTYSEKHQPSEVVALLNEYLTQMTYLIFQTEGTLDKYIGDAVMAFWGAPTPQKDHAYRACSTALGMVDLLKNLLHPKWELEGKEKLQIGIGLNTGNMVVGFVGSESIKNYTLIGDAVNLGSRLEGATKEYGVEIIIGEPTYQQVKADMLCRELDLLRVKGKTQPIRIYELMDHRLKAAGMREMKAKVFEEGLGLYRARKWKEASNCFQNCLSLDGKDSPARIFLERCKILEKEPLPADWDGVFVMKTK